jgi:hypothetical protein
MNVTHSLIASLNAAQLRKQISAVIAPILPILSDKLGLSFRDTQRFYWGRSRLEEINSRTREYYHLNLSPSTCGDRFQHRNSSTRWGFVDNIC